MEINPANTACGCPSGGVIKKIVTHAPLSPYGMNFVTVQLHMPGDAQSAQLGNSTATTVQTKVKHSDSTGNPTTQQKVTLPDQITGKYITLQPEPVHKPPFRNSSLGKTKVNEEYY